MRHSAAHGRDLHRIGLPRHERRRFIARLAGDLSWLVGDAEVGGARAGLIGDLTFSRVPVLIGSGHTPFGELPADDPLEHEGTEVFPGGMVQTTYRVRRS